MVQLRAITSECVHQPLHAVFAPALALAQFLNVKLTNIKVVNEAKYPHMVRRVWQPAAEPVPQLTPALLVAQAAVRSCYIRGSVVRYVQLPSNAVDIEILHDATRREQRAG
jgi:hypothetical protein